MNILKLIIWLAERVKMDKQNSAAASSKDFDHRKGMPQDSAVDEELSAVISLLKRKEDGNSNHIPAATRRKPSPPKESLPSKNDSNLQPAERTSVKPTSPKRKSKLKSFSPTGE